MNVGELKAELDNYGDHVEVVIVLEEGGDSRNFRSIDVGYGTVWKDDGEDDGQAVLLNIDHTES